MTACPPVTAQWDGDAFRPLGRSARDCNAHYVVGERYILAEHQQRSAASHNHFFATLHDLWLNLPENQADRFPTEEHLRKWCLIKAGYADHRSIVAASKAEARRVAAFVKPMDEFAVVTVEEAVVNVWTAQSQSLRAMGKKAFQESKDAVLTIAAEMVGVAPDAAVENVARAA